MQATDNTQFFSKLTYWVRPKCDQLNPSHAGNILCSHTPSTFVFTVLRCAAGEWYADHFIEMLHNSGLGLGSFSELTERGAQVTQSPPVASPRPSVASPWPPFVSPRPPFASARSPPPLQPILLPPAPTGHVLFLQSTRDEPMPAPLPPPPLPPRTVLLHSP